MLNVTKHGTIVAGDYALMDGNKTLEVVERKTFDNLLADFGMMPVLHQRLAELAAQDNHALVIEASYADFLNPEKVHHYSPSFCAKAIAEFYALHPTLRIVFCASRKQTSSPTGRGCLAGNCRQDYLQPGTVYACVQSTCGHTPQRV